MDLVESWKNPNLGRVLFDDSLVAILGRGWRWHPYYLEEHLKAHVNSPQTEISLSLHDSKLQHRTVEKILFGGLDLSMVDLGGTSNCVLRGHLFHSNQHVLLRDRQTICDLAMQCRQKGTMKLIPQQLAFPVKQSFSVTAVVKDLTVQVKSLSTLWNRLLVWPVGWGALAGLYLISDFLLTLSKREEHNPSPPEKITELSSVIGCGSVHQVVVGTYLTGKHCPQRGFCFPQDRLDLVKDWRLSLQQTGVTGVLLHDGLPKELVECSNFVGFEFKEVRTQLSSLGNLLYRFQLYLDFLMENSSIEQVFFTDTTDLVVLRSPFAELENGKVYLGSEDDSVGSSLYMWRTTGLSLGWPERMKFLRILRKPLLNCGIVGGYREPVLRLLEAIVVKFERLQPTADSDMSLLNIAARECFSDQEIVTGFPLHSRFKHHEPRRDVVFRHK